MTMCLGAIGMLVAYRNSGDPFQCDNFADIILADFSLGVQQCGS